VTERVVEPEILDRLPADDPDAVAGRRDLRRVNFLMGNERWICRTSVRFAGAAGRGIAELGAGDGSLAAKLARLFPMAAVEAFDLAPRPAGLDPRVRWCEGDLLAGGGPAGGGLLVANLFLHHFEAPELGRIGRICEGFEVLLFNEPDRAGLPHLLGAALHPFINRVTRHDLHVSIRAGFRGGEIGRLLGLDGGRWWVQETSTWRGGRRVLACRR